MHTHGQDRGHGQGHVEAVDLPVTGGGLAVAVVLQQLAHDPPAHQSAGDGLHGHAHRERRRPHPGARHSADGVQHHGGDGHGGQAHHRAVGHPPGEVVADHDPLVEPPVADGARPRQQQQVGDVHEPGHLIRQLQQLAGDQVEHRRDQAHEHHGRDAAVHGVGVGAQADERRAAGDQGGGGAHDHDDGRLDDQGEREGHAIGRQVVLGVGQPGDHRREERALQRHHEPGGGQGGPEAGDLADVQCGHDPLPACSIAIPGGQLKGGLRRVSDRSKASVRPLRRGKPARAPRAGWSENAAAGSVEPAAGENRVTRAGATCRAPSSIRGAAG